MWSLPLKRNCTFETGPGTCLDKDSLVVPLSQLE